MSNPRLAPIGVAYHDPTDTHSARVTLYQAGVDLLRDPRAEVTLYAAPESTTAECTINAVDGRRVRQMLVEERGTIEGVIARRGSTEDGSRARLESRMRELEANLAMVSLLLPKDPTVKVWPIPEGQKVLAGVVLERHRQIEKWGGWRHDDKHSVENWVRFITRYAGWAGMMADLGSTEGICKARKRLVQVAALAIAAVESIDRKLAAGRDVVDGAMMAAPEQSENREADS